VSAYDLRQLAQDIILIGALVMALGYGLRRVYKLAKNIDLMMAQSASEAETRAQVAAQLASHVEVTRQRDVHREEQFNALARDISEVLKEVRPNGGSSIKDTVNDIRIKVSDIHGRVGVLEQWKRDQE
jgi:hypothetical protein